MSIPLFLKEWQQASPDTHRVLAGIKLPQDDETQSLIQKLSNRLNITELARGVAVEATSYVGRIDIGDLQIAIRPKIETTALLHLLQYTYGLRQLDLFSTVTSETEDWSFQDILINQLAAEVSELVMRGLHRRYVRQEEALVSPRGRIAVQTLANQGGIWQASLPCIYYPRLEDCLVNQVLLQGVRLGASLAHDDMLRTHLQHLAHFHLSDLSLVRLDRQTFKRLRREMNRLTIAYIPAITLIELLLAGEGIGIDENQPTMRLPGFLFDMNRFYQDLLTRFLSEYVQDCAVYPQFEMSDMFTYIENPKRQSRPTLRPDYVLKKNGMIIAILDAKYRDLWENDLPPHMLYQLVMYALSQESCNQSTILYPAIESDAQEEEIEVRLPTHALGRVYVVLRPVDLLKLEEIINNSRNKGHSEIERERAKFARWLVFGGEREAAP